MVTKKKASKVDSPRTLKSKISKKINKKSLDISPDPEFYRLLELLRRGTGKGNLQLDPIKYTEEFSKEWLIQERSKRVVRFDSTLDFDHLGRLAVWDHRQVLELLFGIPWAGFAEMDRRGDTCPPTNFYESVRLIQTHRLPDTLEYEPEYNWVSIVTDWQIAGKKARYKLEEILERSWRTIPGLGWKGELWWVYEAKSFVPWLKREFKIMDWLEKQNCRIPNGLESFLAEWKPLTIEAAATAEPVKSEKNITPKAHPAPTTKTAKDKALKAKLRLIYNLLDKKEIPPTYKHILEHPDYKFAIEESGHESSYILPDKTLQNWLTEFRKIN